MRKVPSRMWFISLAVNKHDFVLLLHEAVRFLSVVSTSHYEVTPSRLSYIDIASKIF